MKDFKELTQSEAAILNSFTRAALDEARKQAVASAPKAEPELAAPTFRPESPRETIPSAEMLRRHNLAIHAKFIAENTGLAIVMLDESGAVIEGQAWGKPLRELFRDLGRHFATAERLAAFGIVTESCAIVSGPLDDRDPLVGNIFPPAPYCGTSVSDDECRGLTRANAINWNNRIFISEVLHTTVCENLRKGVVHDYAHF